MVALALVYSAAIAADSATVTAGVVQVAEPRYKGTTMSLYSLIGFSGAFTGPVIFGAALDAGGGDGTVSAWLTAFALVSLLVLLGPLAVLRLVGMGTVYR